jgi:hypothetical protein
VVGVKQDSQAVADKPACLQELTLFFSFLLTLKCKVSLFTTSARTHTLSTYKQKKNIHL